MDKEKVLLVDDVTLFLELEKSFFHEERFEVLTARSGLEAVRMASRQIPSIIFMDLHMGDMNGDEACALIKNDPVLKHIPIIMVTHPDEDDIEKCKSSGCDGFVFKPVTREDFLGTANRYMENRHRLNARIETHLEVRYGSGDGESSLQRFTVNMSSGGVFLETEDILPENTALVLEFTLPDQEKTVRCRGRVAWVNHPGRRVNTRLAPGMGIQFLDLKMEELSAIRQYLQLLSRDSGRGVSSVQGECCALSLN